MKFMWRVAPRLDRRWFCCGNIAWTAPNGNVIPQMPSHIRGILLSNSSDSFNHFESYCAITESREDVSTGGLTNSILSSYENGGRWGSRADLLHINFHYFSSLRNISLAGRILCLFSVAEVI